MREASSKSASHNQRKKLIEVIQTSGGGWEGDLTDDMSLIRSGKLDSLGLFNLATFIERELGRKVDFTAFDLAAEWDTINHILEFIRKLSEGVPGFDQEVHSDGSKVRNRSLSP